MYLYILGRPHSGSTIVNILLANTRHIEGIGEFISDMGKLENRCTCGETIRACPFWSAVRRHLAEAGIDWEEAVAASVGQGHIRRFFATWWARSDDQGMRRLAFITEAIEDAIRAVSGKSVVLDSSKEPTRGLFLLKYLPSSRIIFLIRNPVSAVGSHYWRLRESGKFHILRRDYYRKDLTWFFVIVAAAGWLAGNLLAEIAIRAAPRRATRIRYEDLRDNPEREFERLQAELGLDFTESFEKLERSDTLSVGHHIGGNAIRLEQQLRFDRKREKHPRMNLPLWIELTTLFLCWPLMLRYDYPLRRAPRHPALDMESTAKR